MDFGSWGRLGSARGGLLERPGRLWDRRLGGLWGRLGSLRGSRGGLLGCLGALLGLSWGPLGRFGAILEESWAALERRKAEKARTPRSFKTFEKSMKLASLGGLLGASWGPHGGLLGASRGRLGASWGPLGDLSVQV